LYPTPEGAGFTAQLIRFATVELAHILKLQVIAAGGEIQAQLDSLMRPLPKVAVRLPGPV
jgi:sensor c-di-GMP phosphodiesterase-like protein